MNNIQLIESLEYHIQEFANKKKGQHGKPGRPWIGHKKMTPEELKAYHKQYYQDHKEQMRQQNKLNYQKNKTSLLQKSKDYYKNKPKPIKPTNNRNNYTPDDWDVDFRQQPLTRKDAPDVFDAWDEYNQ